MTSLTIHARRARRLPRRPIRVSLCKLNEIQFSAPWNPRRRARLRLRPSPESALN